MNKRTRQRLIAVTIVIAAIAAAGVTYFFVGQKTVCNSDAPDAWLAVPEIVATAKLAEVLDVSEDRVKAGKLGYVTCEDPVSVRAMETDDPPVVKVPGFAPQCVAIGIGQGESIDATTARHLMVICPASSDNTASAITATTTA